MRGPAAATLAWVFASARQGSKQMHPHTEAWREVLTLVQDGFVRHAPAEISAVLFVLFVAFLKNLREVPPAAVVGSHRVGLVLIS